MENRFYLADHIRNEKPVLNEIADSSDFFQVCRRVKELLEIEWQRENLNSEAALRIQKKAIMGYENEVGFFKCRISEIVKSCRYENVSYPSWYDSLEAAVYHENWGLGGLAEWFTKRYAQSSSAKIIGDRIYFLVDGKMQLQTQRLTKDKREQMVRAFLLMTPEERPDKDVHELYLLDGTRVTIFGGSMTKKNQDAMIFRRYVIPIFRFEEQAARKTIPVESINLFKSMVKLGYNVVFSGAVRTSKTSFLSTWQSYEDPSLEGVMVETDPEINMHRLMPEAPVVQLLADNEKLLGITKNLLRSDADYFILAEARDGIALDTAVKIASKGTRRLKMTFHEREPCDFCHDAAAEIVKSMGGDLAMTARAVAKSFDYIFQFIQLKDKSQKRLKSVYEISYDDERSEIRYVPICTYDVTGDCWNWNWHISKTKEKAGIEEDLEAFCDFSRMLKELGDEELGHVVIRRC